MYGVILPASLDLLKASFAQDCGLAEKALYNITESVTPLPKDGCITERDINALSFLGFLGKCALALDLLQDNIEVAVQSELCKVIHYWISFSHDFQSASNVIKEAQDSLLEALDLSLRDRLFLIDVSDLMFFLEELDFAKLIGMGVSCVSQSTCLGFSKSLDQRFDAAKQVLTRDKVLAILDKTPRGTDMSEICYSYLPIEFWWRKW